MIVPAAPDLGVFMVESHGYYAAVELGGTFDILRTAAPQGALLRARLRIDQRSRIVDGHTIRWAVPVLETPGLGFDALSAGDGAGRFRGSDQAALSPAVETARSEDRPALPPPELPPPATARPHVDVPVVDPGARVTEQGRQLKAGDTARATNARVKALDVEHCEILSATLEAKRLGLDDDGAERILASIERQQKDTHHMRQRKANAVMGDRGITSDEARHDFVLKATGGTTQSTGHLTDEEFAQVIAEAQRVAMGDGAA